MARPPIHPGEFLAEELAEFQISAAQLSRELQVPTNRITQILAAKRAISADTAPRRGQWLGTSPELWINLQKTYERRLAEQEIGHQIRQMIMPRPSRQAYAGSPSSSSSSAQRKSDVVGDESPEDQPLGLREIVQRGTSLGDAKRNQLVTCVGHYPQPIRDP